MSLSGNQLNRSFAIDEDLRFLSPTLWYMPENSNRILKQVWFPGLHASTAGGYSPHSFGDISLCWMISEVIDATKLEFNMAFLEKRFADHSPPVGQPWGAISEPEIPGPDRFAYGFGPKLKRIPGAYPPPPSGNIRNEFYHHSVDERIAGAKNGYPAGRAVVNKLPKLPYTPEEKRLALASGLTTEEHIQRYWGPPAS